MTRSRAAKEMMRKAAPKKWIQKAINPNNKGALHRALGVPEGKKIPESKAETLKHFHR